MNSLHVLYSAFVWKTNKVPTVFLQTRLISDQFQARVCVSHYSIAEKIQFEHCNSNALTCQGLQMEMSCLALSLYAWRQPLTC